MRRRQAFGSRGQMSLNPFHVGHCVCVRPSPLKTKPTARHHSIAAVLASGSLLIVRTACRRAPATSTRVHARSQCVDRSAGFALEKEIEKETSLRTEVGRLMVDRPRFSGSKKQVALGDSLRLSKIQSME